MAARVNGPLVLPPSYPDFGIEVVEVGDQMLSQGSRACICDVRTNGREGLHFFGLNLVPRRIAYNQTESATPTGLFVLGLMASRWNAKHIRKCEVPVEEAVLRSEALDLLLHPRFARMRVPFDAAEWLSRAW